VSHEPAGRSVSLACSTAGTVLSLSLLYAESGLTLTDQRNIMPETLEVVCTDDDCTLDMFELHYTYDMPDGTGVDDFACPYCGGGDCLEAVEL